MSGSYAILERIAVGGMGEVFLARQSGIGGFSRTVVLKRLLPDAEGDDEALRRLLDEARIAGVLAHENVVAIIEVGEGDTSDRRLQHGGPYLALEYVHGDNAGVLIRRAKQRNVEITALAAARIVRDAARGLFHAHTAKTADGAPLGIVHRDVAPKNIFVRNDGVSKIGDFGIAKSERKLAATATGSVPGTLAYMSPEQVRGEVVGAASDQFSLGIVLWELLCAYRLFKAPSPAETVEAILRKKVRVPSRMNAEAWPLDAITMRMLERDPRRRFADLGEVVTAIEAAMPEVAGEEGRVAVLRLVERLLGDDLRAREKKIELGPVSADETVRVPSAPAASASLSDAPDTSDPTRSASNAPTAIERPIRRRRAPLALAAAGLAAIGVVAAVSVGAALFPTDVQRTRAYLATAIRDNAMIDREVIYAIARLDGVPPTVAAQAADRAEELVNERLALQARLWALEVEERDALHLDTLEKERALVERARAALEPLGDKVAPLALDMWAFDSSVPDEWMRPRGDLEVQGDLHAGGLSMMREQTSMRDIAVDALLRRGGADVERVRTLIDPLIAAREALIAELAAAPRARIDGLRAQIEAHEDRVRALLEREAPRTAGAVASLALWMVPRRGAPEPMFPAMPSTVAERETGAVVAER